MNDGINSEVGSRYDLDTLIGTLPEINLWSDNYGLDDNVPICIDIEKDSNTIIGDFYHSTYISAQITRQKSGMKCWP